LWDVEKAIALWGCAMLFRHPTLVLRDYLGSFLIVIGAMDHATDSAVCHDAIDCGEGAMSSTDTVRLHILGREQKQKSACTESACTKSAY
jgi:hypothetical protein